MEPLQEAGLDGPQQDDIRGAQHNYGDTYEPNDTAATATPIGAVTPGVTVSFGSVSLPPSGTVVPAAGSLSIDAAGKVDWYSFTTGSALPAVVNVSPMGGIYDNSAQASNGSCQRVTPSSGISTRSIRSPGRWLSKMSGISIADPISSVDWRYQCEGAEPAGQGLQHEQPASPGDMKSANTSPNGGRSRA